MGAVLEFGSRENEDELKKCGEYVNSSKETRLGDTAQGPWWRPFLDCWPQGVDTRKTLHFAAVFPS